VSLRVLGGSVCVPVGVGLVAGAVLLDLSSISGSGKWQNEAFCCYKFAFFTCSITKTVGRSAPNARIETASACVRHSLAKKSVKSTFFDTPAHAGDDPSVATPI
jgi:hypothetical protein